jgi:hypothetical protein
MVCRRMGLLDDAIREHLELKRLRGADPGEVAREQQEALEPIGGGSATADHLDEAASAEATGGKAGGAGGTDNGGAGATHAGADDAAAGIADAGRAAEQSSLVEETAELDMRSVLGERADAPATDAIDAGERDGAGEDGHDDDALDWEVPAQRDEGALEESPER